MYAAFVETVIARFKIKKRLRDIIALIKLHTVTSVYIRFGVRSQIDVNKADYNKTWIYFPDGDGNPQIAYLVEPPPENRDVLPSIIQFEFYISGYKPLVSNFTLNVDKESRYKRDSWEEITQKFNPSLDTKILVHGWKSSTQSNSIQSIRGAYAQRGQLNIFAINWRDQADNIYYLRPARYTVQVGRAIARLIDLLVEVKGADQNRIHLIGHSLGAHIMGYAGSYTKYRVGRITGLDPARPAFEDITGPENHLDYTDAHLVDIIHSCAGLLGFKKPIGHADFYPNGGTPPQPGCLDICQIFTGCSHGRSYEYYAESINSTKGFESAACQNLKEFEYGNCSGSRILMGDPMPATAKGIYYLKTSNKSPFALGEYTGTKQET